MGNLAIYKVNNKALNNGKQIDYSDPIAILNKDLKEVTISDYEEDPSLYPGRKICLRCNRITTDTSNLPENVLHIIGDNVYVETKTLTDNQRNKLLTVCINDQFIIEHGNLIEAIKEAILNGNDRRTALAKVVNETEKISKTEIYFALDVLEGGLWKMTKGHHNSKVYSLL